MLMFLIQPKVGGFSSRDFHCSRELIDLGRQAAEEKLEEIARVLKYLIIIL